MTNSSVAPAAGLSGQLKRLRNLAQPFFLPLDQASGWQFSGLLLSLLFCVGGLVLVALTGLINLSEQLLPAHLKNISVASAPPLMASGVAGGVSFFRHYSCWEHRPSC